ncbi:hypothetical protein RvY_15356-3 [Ramazzottius varieornatus]|uniref:Uncharacterized protein n=1 Tax=Ramazzottius varieornatus TaxID=947166 RepID=A0A1D1VZC6_RAMVA|nr:hypothetical protein RvY_15356-3 [Ramazzottius varieornatus]
MSAEDQAKYRELQDELQRQSVMEEQLIKELESLKHGERAKMEEVRSPCPSRPKDKVQLGKSTMTDRTPSSNIFVFCRQELSFVPLKKEAAQVYSRIRDLQSTLEDVRQQINRPPVQELKRLVDQIKQENAEVSALERQYRTLQDIMSTIQQQGTVSSAGTASYPLSGYQDRYEELTAELKSSEAENLRKLEQLSKNVDALNELPITSEADVRKSGEQLRSTVGKVQHAQRMCEDLLQMNLEEYTRELRKIELLLVTLNKEKQQRQTDISKWEKEFQIGGDIKVVLTKRNEDLKRELSRLQQEKTSLTQAVSESRNALQQQKTSLSKKPTHQKIIEAEHELQKLQAQTFDLEEVLADAKLTGTYEEVKASVLQKAREVNAMLQRLAQLENSADQEIP